MRGFCGWVALPTNGFHEIGPERNMGTETATHIRELTVPAETDDFVTPPAYFKLLILQMPPPSLPQCSRFLLKSNSSMIMQKKLN